MFCVSVRIILSHYFTIRQFHEYRMCESAVKNNFSSSKFIDVHKLDECMILFWVLKLMANFDFTLKLPAIFCPVQ